MRRLLIAAAATGLLILRAIAAHFVLTNVAGSGSTAESAGVTCTNCDR